MRGEPQYAQSIVVPLPDPTDDSLVLTAAAMSGLGKIFRGSFRYKKAGVVLNLLSDKPVVQQSLFEDIQAKGQSAELMKTIDEINTRFGSNLIKSAAMGTKQAWAMRSDNRSPSYTTNWNQLPFVY
jgi:DNA polymerase V